VRSGFASLASPFSQRGVAIVIHCITLPADRWRILPQAKRTKSFSARFSAEVVDRLDAHSERLGQSKARVAERLIEEGLRTEEFPGIIFRSGPAGRRAGIAGGPDVWEIVRDLKGAAREGAGDPIDAVSRISGLDGGKVRLAADYYAAYPAEVEERIRLDEEAAERLRRALGVPSAA
jgi:predicted transcriptional regulator